jgi:septal ring factor EnvC (AmiA/AmiB activator)
VHNQFAHSKLQELEMKLAAEASEAEKCKLLVEEIMKDKSILYAETLSLKTENLVLQKKVQELEQQISITQLTPDEIKATNAEIRASAAEARVVEAELKLLAAYKATTEAHSLKIKAISDQFSSIERVEVRCRLKLRLFEITSITPMSIFSDFANCRLSRTSQFRSSYKA